MKFLCLAYGDEDGWNSLNEDEKTEVLSNDKVIRDRGNIMSALRPKVTLVRNWDKKLEIKEESYAKHYLPLAGFSLIEAESLNEGIELVSNTPCARAKGVIEIRPFWGLNADGA
jgi:hypothetical protein